MSQSRRSAGTETTREPAPNESNPLEASYVGVDDERVADDPDAYAGELFEKANFNTLNTPDVYPAGGNARISGVIGYDEPGSTIFSRGMRVRISSPALSRDYIERYEDIRHGNTRSFSLSIPIPDAPGDRFAYTVRAESTRITGGFGTDSTRGPFNVEIQTQTAANVSNGFTYVPYAAVGAGVGLLTDSVADVPTSRYQSAAIGGAAGAVFKKYGRSLGVNVGNIVPNVSTTRLAVGAAGIFGAAYLLNSTGASEVLQPVGETVGAAASVGSAAAQRGADAARSRLSSPRTR